MTRFADAAGRLAGVAGWLLGWRPDEFWRATPDELADALGAIRDLHGDADAPMGRGLLSDLMERHPDG